MAEDIFSYDKTNLREIIRETPQQFKDGQKAAQESLKDYDFQKNSEKPRSLILCGIGGSPLAGYLIESLSYLKIPIQIFSNYELPEGANSKDLVFLSSFSGNTEETLSAQQEVIKQKIPAFSFSNGGKLAIISKENQIPHVAYNITLEGFQPRYALFYSFSAMVYVLEKLGLVKDALQKIEGVTQFAKKLDDEAMEQEGRELAQKIKGTIPVFYADYELRYAARINKIKINENAKNPAFWNYYPELNHNEFIGYVNGNPQCLSIVQLKNDLAHPRNQKRFAVTKNLLEELGYSVYEPEIKGKNTLEKFYYALHLGDWISYYLALFLKQDPAPVDMVEELKQKMKE